MDGLDAPIDELEIDRAHRSGSKYKDKNGKWQKQDLLKFNSWKARNTFYRLRKDSRFHLRADLTNRKECVLKYAKYQINTKGSLASDAIKYVYADANCTRMAFTYTGRFLSFNTENEFDLLPLYVDNDSSSSESIYDTIEKELEML